MARYKGADSLAVQYLDFTEANYGNRGAGVYTLKLFGYVIENPPLMDPNRKRVDVLRNVNPGIPISLKKYYEDTKTTIKWMQPTLAEYVQKNLFADYDNLWMVNRIDAGGGSSFIIDQTGMKPNTFKVSVSKDEDMMWSMDMIGKETTTPAALPGTPTYGPEASTDPWDWAGCYLQYDSGSGLTLFPDVTDVEIAISDMLVPNRVLTDSGTYQLSSLEKISMGKPTATVTANLMNETAYDWVLLGTEVDLKLCMPDSKYILLNDGKFKAPGLTFKPEGLLAQRLEYEAKSWTHNFT